MIVARYKKLNTTYKSPPKSPFAISRVYLATLPHGSAKVKGTNDSGKIKKTQHHLQIHTKITIRNISGPSFCPNEVFFEGWRLDQKPVSNLIALNTNITVR
jgi:hypothetical protein